MSTKPANKKPVADAAKTKGNPFWLYLSGILVFTFIIYYSVGSFDFLNWDDQTFVLENATITSLSFQNIRTIFSTFYMGNYCPLSILSYAVDYQIAGLSASWFHMVALFLHLANTGLVFLFIYLLSKKELMIAAIAALLFGIHPMHVESVAWIAERRDLLYCLFYLLGLISYLRYTAGNYAPKYPVYTVVFFLCSLLSKGQAVTFPLVLLVIDYIQYRKFDRRAILEKVPFFVLSLIFGYIAVVAQKTIPALNMAHISTVNSLFAGNYGLLLYLVKVIVPFKLSGYHAYPFSGDGSLPVIVYLAPIIIIALAVALYMKFKQDRSIIGGFLFFLATIFPVLQFLPVGDTIISERYTYIPYIGLFFVIGYLYVSVDKFALLSKVKPYLGYVLASFLVLMSVISFGRVKAWENSVIFWTDVIDKYPNCKIPYNCRGYMYYQFKEYDLAFADFNKGISLDTTYGTLYLNRAICYERQKKTDLAFRDYCRSISLDTTNPMCYLNRGIMYTDVYSKYDSGIQDFKKALQINPGLTDAVNNMGVAYFKKGDIDNAIVQYNKSIEKNPLEGSVYYLRAVAFAAKKDYSKAFADGKQCRQLGYKIDDNLLREWESQAK